MEPRDGLEKRVAQRPARGRRAAVVSAKPSTTAAHSIGSQNSNPWRMTRRKSHAVLVPTSTSLACVEHGPVAGEDLLHDAHIDEAVVRGPSMGPTGNENENGGNTDQDEREEVGPSLLRIDPRPRIDARARRWCHRSHLSAVATRAGPRQPRLRSVRVRQPAACGRSELRIRRMFAPSITRSGCKLRMRARSRPPDGHRRLVCTRWAHRTPTTGGVRHAPPSRSMRD